MLVQINWFRGISPTRKIISATLVASFKIIDVTCGTDAAVLYVGGYV